IRTEVRSEGKTSEANESASVPLHPYGMIIFGESPDNQPVDIEVYLCYLTSHERASAAAAVRR
ncbi:MAG: hypothetical protein ACYC7L_15820, partial [Nitrospirota bacterium]